MQLKGLPIQNKRKHLIEFITKAAQERKSTNSLSNAAAFDTPQRTNSRMSNPASILALSKQSAKQNNSSENSDYLSDLEKSDEDYQSGDSENNIKSQSE